jgi:hypothetical protein
MMTSVVNAALKATIRLTVQGASGQAHEIEAGVDTGFSGLGRERSRVGGTRPRV